MLKSMRIGRKLLLSFICLLVLTMIVGRVGKSGMDTISVNMDHVQSVNDILTQFNTARIHEQRFALTSDKQDAETLRSALAQLKNQGVALSNELKDKEAKSKVSQALTDAESYYTAFNNYARISGLREQSMEQMKDSSNDAFKEIKGLETALNEILEDTIASRDQYEDEYDYQDDLAYVMEQLGYTQTISLLFLNARKFEKEHIISLDEKFLERARKSIKNMLILAQRLEDSFDDEDNIAMTQEARAQILKYQQNFENHANQMTEQQQLNKEMHNSAMNAQEACLAALSAIKKGSEKSLSQANIILISISALAVIIGLILAIRISRGISIPLTRTVEMLDALENGHINTRLNLDRGDEIGQLAKTMDRFADSLNTEVVEPLNRLASGNLDFDVHPHDERDLLRTALKKLGDDMNNIMLEVQMAGEQINSGSSQVSDSSQDLSQGATEQASSLEEISSSLQELSSQTTHNADSANDASKLTEQVQTNAEQGRDQMGSMNKAMADINEASQNISKIIKVIDEIAFQTNLLALNAAVEAARAGQHGKGFAVVAEEVRNLAARSAKAAQETTELIEGSVAKAEAGAEIAKKTAESLEKIVTGVTEATTLASQIARASTEQAQGISQISIGVSQIDDVTQQNTACAEETAAAAEELRSQADTLQHLLSRFTLRQGSAPSFALNDEAFSMPTQTPAAKVQPALEQPPQAEQPPQQQPAAAAATIDIGDNDEVWGGASTSGPVKIALDDDEFGKY
ncbi:HAMP domain-containing methyl-accepting chemotaxis protein [Desulfuromonas acetoxidans]|uniref:Methyl-accepting chemotaxis sensory transducer n=1 Tax=Desulfuromonas acetoxidans (strain DSM 684 / 11070) TaxID=281689 RepID=Q1JVJ7_DESA6|nr:methyl-accepting chemotaxis protein [Desulfuromonas acetoxidans]EAT14273.1 methyl-accepting chemotaxis sensory transducer [Desulfuromonas acetoxidans DSM 684]